MLRISNVNVYGLEESSIAAGYPMRVDLPRLMPECEQKDIDRLKKNKDREMRINKNNYIANWKSLEKEIREFLKCPDKWYNNE